MLNTNEKIIKHKVGLLNLAEELGNVSRACKVMGVSRDTFYRYQAAVEAGGIEALFEQSRRKPNFSNRVDEQTEEAVVAHATDFPAHGQARTSNELRQRRSQCLAAPWSGELQAAVEGAGSQSRQGGPGPDRGPGSGPGEEEARR